MVVLRLSLTLTQEGFGLEPRSRPRSFCVQFACSLTSFQVNVRLIDLSVYQGVKLRGILLVEDH